MPTSDDKGYVHDDFDLPQGWTSERKWQRIRELLAGAVSVEVMRADSGYTLRVWTLAPPGPSSEG